MKHNQYELLTKRRYFPLFMVQFLQAFNDNFFKTTLVTVIAYQASMSSTKMQLMENFAIFLFILPFFLCSATAGQLADKFEKSILIRIIKVIEVIFIAFASYFLLYTNVNMLIFCLFLIGAHSAFFGPIKYSILPDHLEEDELIGGNALIEASTFVAILFGAILGGLIIGLKHGAGIGAAMLSLVAISGLVASFFIPKTKIASPDLDINVWNFWEETWNIVKHTRKNKDVYISILGVSWFWFVGTTFITQFPILSKEVIGANQSVMTLFLVMFSIGIAVGSLICNRLLEGEITSKYVPLGVFGMSIFVFDLNFTLNLIGPAPAQLMNWVTFLHSWHLVHILLDVMLIAFCGGIYVVPLYAILQSRTEPEYRSRTIACSNILGSLFMVGSAVMVMILYKLNFSVNQIFLVTGLLNTAAAVYICKLLPEALIKSFVNWILQALFSVEVKGLENYKAAGDKVLIVANHTSYLDIVLLSAFLPDKFTIAINTYAAQRWWIRPILGLANTFPIDPTNPMATKSIIKVIRDGAKCVIFPEGRLTVTGSLMKVYEGPGLVADKSGATLVAIRIDGAQYSIFSRLRGKVRIQLFPKMTLTIMPPERFFGRPDLKGRARRRYMGTQLYNIMTNMIFESSSYNQTLFEALTDARIIHKGSFKICEDTERKPISYNQFIARTFILGKQIAKLAPAKSYVGIMLPTSNAAAITFFAMQAYGRIPALLNFSTGFNTLLSACKTANIKLIFTSQRFVTTAKLEDIITRLQESGIEIIFLENFRETISHYDKFVGLMAGYFGKYEYARNNPDRQRTDPAVVLFTSGSEGKPKGVVLSHRNLLSNCYQLQSRVDFTSRDIIFNTLPVFHSFGLTAGTLFPIISGIQAFFYPSPLHYRIVPELVYDTSATIMFGTDTFLSGYARYAHTYDFYSVRYIFAGAEKLKAETRKTYSDKFGVRIFEGYGATETAPVISTNTPMLNKPGTVGCMLPTMEYRIEPVPGIETGGRLQVRGPNVMLGYLRPDNPGVLETSESGWYDTGDIVDIDEDEYITIKGRAKRFAKVGGEMVSLTMIETYLSQLWPDNMHAVVSIPDMKRGEQIVLVTDYVDAKREDIVAHIRQHGLSELSLPKRILILKQVPILATGKLDYPSIEDIVEKSPV